MNVVSLQGRSSGRLSGGANPNVVAALDLGSTKICCMIAQLQPAKQRGGDIRQLLKIIGFGHTASRGIKAGAVVDVAQAECAIRLAVDAAERMAQVSIADVYVSVAGGRPQSFCFSGQAATQEGIVMPRDLEQAVASALAKVAIGKRSILHLNPINHVLDGIGEIENPIGLHGDVLQADIGVTSVEPNYLRNLNAAVERAHLRVAGYVVAPYAAAKACLNADELKLGTFVIDMGGALTSIGCFKNGHLIAADTVPLGGLHVTHDIAQGLCTTIAHAERMKTMWGSVLPDGHDAREMLSVPLLGERGVDTIQKVPKSYLTNILRPRLEETFELVRDQINAPVFAQPAGARVVLTGGGSQLTGVRELATSILGLHVRLGQSFKFAGLPEGASHAGFVGVTGTLSFAAKPDTYYAVPEQAAVSLQRAQMGYVRRVGQWLAEAF